MQFLIVIATLAYFLFALASIMDKHIVSNTSLSPVAYAFYSSFFQILYVIAVFLIALAFPWINLNFPSADLSILAIIDGGIFVFALLSLYKATAMGEISRISPIVGILVPIFTFLLSAIFLKESLDFHQTLAFVFFIGGGFLMSARIEKNGLSYIKGTNFAIIAGFIFAVYYVIMDFLFKRAGFVEISIFIQFGGFLGSILLLLREEDRNLIFHKNNRIIKSRETHGTTIFFANKALSAIGALLLNYAIAIGSVTIVNSLQVVQYAFVLILSLILSKKVPHFFNEETHNRVVLQKGIALGLTAIGLILIA